MTRPHLHNPERAESSAINARLSRRIAFSRVTVVVTSSWLVSPVLAFDVVPAIGSYDLVACFANGPTVEGLPEFTYSCAADRTMTLRLGTPTALVLERPFKTVLVGGRSIVDVHTLTDRRVTLEPLNLGETSLIFLDDRSIVITNLRIVVLGPDNI
jgi:Flp pilus assembly secretin CpaC